TGRPLTTTGTDPYLASTNYYPFGAVNQRTLGAAGKRVRLTTAIEEATGRLTRNAVDTENLNSPGSWVEQLTENYTYDPTGNITSTGETNAGTTVPNQCISYDGLRQLTDAWTP